MQVREALDDATEGGAAIEGTVDQDDDRGLLVVGLVLENIEAPRDGAHRMTTGGLR
jgi:hypothetical protein